MKKNKEPARNDFDSLAKQVLSYKRILAYVIKAAAQEYKDCSIEAIEKLIEKVHILKNQSIIKLRRCIRYGFSFQMY